MTGKYNARNYKAFGYLDPAETTFAHIMKNAGYATMIAGKWQLNGLSYKDRFPDYGNNKRPYEAGFDEYSLWQLTRERQIAERYWQALIEENGRMLQEEIKDQYGPDHFTDFSPIFAGNL